MLSNLRSLKLVAPCAPSRTVAAGLDEGLAGLTALQELSLALHSTMFTVRTAPAVRPVDGALQGDRHRRMYDRTSAARSLSARFIWKQSGTLTRDISVQVLG